SLSFDHISAEVLLPKRVPAAELRAEAYTGAQGARGREYQSFIRDGAVGFTSTGSFRPYEGMTIVVGFPKATVSEPGIFRRAGWRAAATCRSRTRRAASCSRPPERPSSSCPASAWWRRSPLATR